MDYNLSDIEIYNIAPEFLEKIKTPRGVIKYSSTPADIKRYKNLSKYDSREDILKNMTFHTHQRFYISDDVKKIKNIHIITDAIRHIYMYLDNPYLNFEDLMELNIDVKKYDYINHTLIVGETSKLYKILEYEYKELGMKEFNKKYQNVLNHLVHNNINIIVINSDIFLQDLTYSKEHKLWISHEDLINKYNTPMQF